MENYQKLEKIGEGEQPLRRIAQSDLPLVLTKSLTLYDQGPTASYTKPVI